MIYIELYCGINPFGAGPPLTGGEYLGCMQGPFVNRHHFYSPSSEHDDDSQWLLTPA